MFVADAHCDTLYKLLRGETRDLAVTKQRLAAGGVGLQTLAMYCGGKDEPDGFVRRGEKMLALAEAPGIPLIRGRLPDAPPDTPHAILSVEGAEVFGGSLDAFERYADAGVKMVALTWNYENEVAYPAAGGTDKPLKPFGRDLIARMNERGVLCDVSHINDRGFEDVMALSRLPVVASHSNLREICPAPRNLTRAMALSLIAGGGFIGVNFYARFLRAEGTATLEDVFRVIDALCEMGGAKAVGFGSDFDGIEAWPEGLDDPSRFPALLDVMRAHGYGEDVIADIAGLNFLRVLQRAQARA